MPSPAVFVFVMEGCGACEEYLPRFSKIAEPYHAQGLPIGVYDIAKHGREAEFGTRMGIQATPTTIRMDGAGRFHKHVGAISDGAIAALLKAAVRG